MNPDQVRRGRIGKAAWAFMGLLGEIKPESAYWRGERQDDDRVNAYVELLERSAEAAEESGPGADSVI